MITTLRITDKSGYNIKISTEINKSRNLRMTWTLDMIKLLLLCSKFLTLHAAFKLTKCLYAPTQTVSKIGCFSDNPNHSPTGDVRLFDFLYQLNTQYDFSYMNNDVCILICLERGYYYAGTQAGLQCFCGNNPYQHSFHPQVDDWWCGRSCHGNTSQTCGDDYKVDVYSTGLKPFKNEQVWRIEKFATSVQLPGQHLDILTDITKIQCGSKCILHKDCRAFTYKQTTCKLYTIYSSGMCYQVSNGILSSAGEDLYAIVS